MNIKRVIKNLIYFKLKSDTSKNIPGISLELLWAVWGQLSFRYFLVPACTFSQGLEVPSGAHSMLTTGF